MHVQSWNLYEEVSDDVMATWLARTQDYICEGESDSSLSKQEQADSMCGSLLDAIKMCAESVVGV